jgi:hypothetical protein
VDLSGFHDMGLDWCTNGGLTWDAEGCTEDCRLAGGKKQMNVKDLMIK